MHPKSAPPRKPPKAPAAPPPPPGWAVGGQSVLPSGAKVKEEAKRLPRTDSQQLYGRIDIQCFDRLSRKPLAGQGLPSQCVLSSRLTWAASLVPETTRGVPT